jgi:lipopolysaccharide export system protein LptA
MMLRPARACLCALALLSPAFAAERPASAAPPAPQAPMVPTVIESGSAEMISSETETTFTFRDGVTITATNLKMTCEQLFVVARRTGDPGATFGKQEDFKSLVAIGNVRILQNDREATCERAEVFPGEDKVVLTGNPRIRSLDNQYQAEGPMMVLHRGERRAQIIAEAGQRPRITLPPLKDLGYEREPEPTPRPPGAADAPARNPATRPAATPKSAPTKP